MQECVLLECVCRQGVCTPSSIRVKQCVIMFFVLFLFLSSCQTGIFDNTAAELACAHAEHAM